MQYSIMAKGRLQSRPYCVLITNSTLQHMRYWLPGSLYGKATARAFFRLTNHRATWWLKSLCWGVKRLWLVNWKKKHGLELVLNARVVLLVQSELFDHHVTARKKMHYAFMRITDILKVRVNCRFSPLIFAFEEFIIFQVKSQLSLDLHLSNESLVISRGPSFFAPQQSVSKASWKFFPSHFPLLLCRLLFSHGLTFKVNAPTVKIHSTTNRKVS